MTTPNQTPDGSILDVVARSIANPANYIGGGDEAKLYRLDGSDDIVVRVTNADAVVTTTQLQVAADIYDGANLGHETHRGNGFTLNRLQRGQSPEHLIHARAAQLGNGAHASIEALTGYFEKMGALPEESYVRFLQDMQKATDAGHTIDPYNCNYMVDFDANPPRIGWVDINPRGDHSTSRNYMSQVQYLILNSSAGGNHREAMDAHEKTLAAAAQNGDAHAAALLERLQASRETLRTTLDRAGTVAGTFTSASDLSNYEDRHVPDVADAYHGKPAVIDAGTAAATLLRPPAVDVNAAPHQQPHAAAVPETSPLSMAEETPVRRPGRNIGHNAAGRYGSVSFPNPLLGGMPGLVEEGHRPRPAPAAKPAPVADAPQAPHAATAPDAAPKAMHRVAPRANFTGTAMSMAGLVHGIENFSQNGGAANATIMGSMVVSAVDDLSHGKVLGKVSRNVHLPKFVGAVPDLVNLLNAETQDQKVAAGTNLAVSAGTATLLELSSVGGPQAVAIVMAASYVGERTLVPTIKLADGWLSNDKEKMAIGIARLSAGVNELDYKLGSVTGNVVLVGNVIGGAGDVVSGAGNLIGSGQDWLAEKMVGKEYAQMQKKLRDAKIVVPSPIGGGMDAALALGYLGEGMNWAGGKVEEFGDWLTEKSGIGADARNKARMHGKNADELQQKYDQAHRRKAPERVLEAGKHIEAYSKSAKKLTDLLSSSGTVPISTLTKAQKEYEAAYQAMVTDPIYRSAASTPMEYLQQAEKYTFKAPVTDNLRYDPVLSAEISREKQQAAAQKYKEWQEYLFNPVTPQFKQAVEELHGKSAQLVDLKKQQRYGELAQDGYAVLAKRHNASGKALEGCIESLAKVDVQLGALDSSIDKALAEEAVIPADVLQLTQEKVTALLTQRETLSAQLGKFEKTNMALQGEHRKLMKTNRVYKTSAQCKTFGEALAATEKSIDHMQQVEGEALKAQFAEKIAVLAEAAAPAAVVETAAGQAVDASLSRAIDGAAAQDPALQRALQETAGKLGMPPAAATNETPEMADIVASLRNSGIRYGGQTAEPQHAPAYSGIAPQHGGNMER